ncbi:MAG TPA: DinB family protein [Spirochaetia bacterium]|nr:DinB family protein [Spirochaetia bacterium]
MDEKKLREQLAYSLSGKGAHLSFDKAVKGFPLQLIGTRVANLAHTAWQLVHHLWIAQWDILEFSRNPSHESPEWPRGYWPAEDAPAAEEDWDETVRKFRADLDSMIALVRDPESDLFTPFAHGDGQTLLREAILVIDHNAYHVGQLVDLRRLLGVGV